MKIQKIYFDYLSKWLYFYPITEKIHNIEKLDGYGSENYKITLINNEILLFKLYNSKETLQFVKSQTTFLTFLNAKKLPIEFNKPYFKEFGVVEHQDGYYTQLLTYIEGQLLSKTPFHSENLLFDFGQKTALFNSNTLNYRDPVIESHQHDWDLKNCLICWPDSKYIEKASKRKFIDYYFDYYQYFIQPKIQYFRKSIIHNDLNDNNIIVDNQKVVGFIDMGDMCYAPLINEVAVAVTYLLLLPSSKNFEFVIPYLKGYHSIFKLDIEEIKILYYLIASRLCQSVCHSSKEKALENNTEYILISEKPAWQLLEKWHAINPDYITNVFLEALEFPIKSNNSTQINILKSRKKYLLSSLSLSYDKPIFMKKALFQYMYDNNGNSFLDAYNNIPHVGHSHPKISQTISNQVRKLNTNTRYLYKQITDYAEKLLGYFPEQLNKIAFVNSGSEATELALRLAKKHTQREHILVLEHGYHGNTQTAINISAYKFDGKGGKGANKNITKMPLPNTFQGKFSNGLDYAKEAIQIIDNMIHNGILPSLLIAEPISGCGGQVPLAKDYLKILSPYLKEKGILLIIDEVQTGLGRLGHHFWGFEMHDITPDIVILGKAIGNGHPLGAVIFIDAINNSFNNGMEYFSSFGGNPISMAVGKSVLEIIEEEELQQNAKIVGDYFISQAKELQKLIPELVDVRGQGLFIGLEFQYPESQKANTTFAQKVKNDLRKKFILTSTDGPNNNVLKIKPPLCFTKENIDFFIDVLQKVTLKNK